MSISSLIGKHAVSVVVQSKGAGTLDAVGSHIESFSDETVMDAIIQISGGSDATYAGREQHQRSGTAYFQGVGLGIEVKDRITYNGSTFEIRDVRTPDERPATSHLAYTIVSIEEVLA